MYLKKTCPKCTGTGWTLNIFDSRNWIPFHWPTNLWTKCYRCKGTGTVYSKWNDRRRV